MLNHPKPHLATARLVLLLSALFLAPLAHAQDQESVLIAHVPRGANDGQVRAIVKQALIGRQWTVSIEDPLSVTGRLEHGYTGAEIKVYRSRERLVYTDSSTGVTMLSPTVRSAPRPLPAPQRWIENLRSDIARQFATISDDPPPVAAQGSSADALERLRALKGMLDSGLITTDDYEQKKMAILQGL